MNQTKVSIRFFGRLNDFLRPSRRNHYIDETVDGHPAVLDTIQALGVPHAETFRLLLGNHKINLNYQLRDGDRIRVYPKMKFVSGRPRFILDVHLGKLKKYLRLLGFDAAYRTDYADWFIIKMAAKEKRVILTRDLGLLKHRNVRAGYWIRETDAKKQINEVIRIFNLRPAIKPFVYCLECNGKLIRVNKSEILKRLQPKTRKYFRKFHRCSRCRRIYWAGSHYKRMSRFISRYRRL